MWIQGWSIDAFGHLNDVRIEGLTDGVNVVVGPNESGKTTTLHFLRWVLFGFPRAQSSVVRRYRPGSALYGGRVRMMHDGRVIDVQRHQGDAQPTLSTADGSPLPPPRWTDVVGTAGRELFESIFAITTDELGGFSSLDPDEVREHIYAAGLVGSGPSAREALGDLDERRDELLRPRSGTIRDIHRRLGEHTEELRAAASKAIGLADRRAGLAGLRASVDELDARRRELDTEANHLMDLIEAWPIWCKATDLRRRLADMGSGVHPPADPIGRLEAHTAAIDNATVALAAAERELQHNTARMESIPTDERLPPLEAPAHELDRQSAVVTRLETDLIGLESARERHSAHLSEALAALGPGWTVERISTMDLSLPVYQRARELAERSRSTEARLEQAASALRHAEQAEAEQARWAALTAETRPTAITRIPRGAIAAMIAVTALATVAAAASVATGAPLATAGFTSVALLTAWLWWILAHTSGSSPRRYLAEQADLESDPPPAPSQLDTLSRERADAVRARELFETDWERWCSELGLPSGLRAQDCVELLDRVRSTRAAAETHEQTLRAIAHVVREVDQHRREVTALASRAGIDAPEPGSQLRSVLEAIHADAENRRILDDLGRARARQRQDADRASQTLQEAEAALEMLLRGVGARDVEEYRAAIEGEQARRRITETLTEIESELRGRFGAGDALDEAREELATGDLRLWKERIDILQTDQAEARAAHEAAVEAYSLEVAALTEEERSADVATSSLQVEALRSELHEAMQDWTVATIAHKAISDTLRRFETERQPEVVRSAAESFSRITGGRYSSLVPTDDGIEVRSPGGRGIDSSQLSRGATEQLYLVMRFALARQYARRNALPLVLDDVMVNADPKRRVRLAEELHEVSSDLQVLLFTCHRATAELLGDTPRCAGARRSANIVEMTS